MTSLSFRFTHLRHAVEMTARKIAEEQFEADGLIRGIFVAPEDLFAARNAGLEIEGVTRSRSMSSARHDLVINWLTRLSERHRRILIVPGTIAWETRFGTGNEFKSMETSLVSGLNHRYFLDFSYVTARHYMFSIETADDI